MAPQETPLKIRFVTEGPQKQSLREKELDVSERKAHSARIAHERARAKRDREAASKKALNADSEPSTSTAQPAPKRKGIKHVKQRHGTRNVFFDKPVVKKVSVEHSVRPPSPKLPPPIKGDSDPFGVLAIPVTPQVKQVLQFMKDGVYPGLYFNSFFKRMYGDIKVKDLETSTWLPAQTALAGWKYALASLQDEGIALACVGGYLHNMSMLMLDSSKSKATNLGLSMMTKSSVLLRRSLHKSMQKNSSMGTTLINHVYWLFRAAIFSGDEESIIAHGRMLNLCLMKGLVEGTADIQMLIQSGVDDVDICSRLMRRPFIHPDAYAATCAGLWALAEANLPKMTIEINMELHSNVQCPEVQQAFLICRSLAGYAEQQITDEEWGSPTQKQLSFAWFVTKSDWGMRQALSASLDLRDDKYSSQVWSEGVRLTQASLGLAVLYYGRLLGHDAVINGVDIRDISATIMAHLQVIMTQVLAKCSDEELEAYVDAHTWILFVGAFIEQRNKKKNSGRSQVRWFQHRLAEHAVRHKRESWLLEKSTFESFHYFDFIEPNGAQWYEEVIAELAPPKAQD
ncbi:hypothetical protein PV10_04261 [Exophiala mesophila]|uniref:Uncharacterized protein n=1 Tax=Exophiala mesophila TaxID=212818 RepID=A0A0D1XXU3_EXOME|nr:uncharacterized protein PV10_04261 [Exophiala mesophila]KIV93016.1 hypothetical protein PV10_04261 [Exophiala mesophila]